MMEARRKKMMRCFFLINAGLVAFAAVFVLIAFLELRIFGCVAYDLFHLYCPLCGGTRALFALLELDIISALKYNIFIFYLAFALVAYDVKACIWALRGRDNAFAVPKWLIWTSVAMCVLFFIGRNLLMIVWGIDPAGDLVTYWR